MICRRCAQTAKKTLRVVSILIGSLIFVPLVYWSGVYGSYARQFPVILNFEVYSDRLLLDPVNSNVSIIDAGGIGGDFSGSIVEIELLRTGWTGVRILPVIGDWSDYQTLSFQIAMVGGTQPRFGVRLSYGLHPGFRPHHYMGGDSAGPQPKRVRISLQGAAEVPGRPDLEISNIIELHIVGRDLQTGTVMYLDEFRLE